MKFALQMSNYQIREEHRISERYQKVLNTHPEYQ